MPKKERPPVEFDTQWTEDETNPGGKEPSQKLTAELAREIARIVARRDVTMGIKDRDPASLRQAMASVLEEIFASARVPTPNAPRPEKK
jgi:hypothetical protein